MATIASICSSCGLICITLKSPKRGANCIKCGEHFEIIRANSIEELWSHVSANPPQPYSDTSDKELLNARFTKAHERFMERMRQRNGDNKMDPKWQAAVYFARKGLREAALLRRPVRRRRAKKKAL